MNRYERYMPYFVAVGLVFATVVYIYWTQSRRNARVLI